MARLTFQEFEANVEGVLARAEAGEAIFIERNGEPVLQIVRCPEPWEIRLGIRRASLPMEGFKIPTIPLDGPVDSVELIRAGRAERDLLP